MVGSDGNVRGSDVYGDKEFGAHIAARRRFLRWSQDDLAEHAGLSRPTIARLEAGKNSGEVTINKVLKTIDIGFYKIGIDPNSVQANLTDAKHRRVSRKRNRQRNKQVAPNTSNLTSPPPVHHANHTSLDKPSSATDATKRVVERAPLPVFMAPKVL